MPLKPVPSAPLRRRQQASGSAETFGYCSSATGSHSAQHDADCARAKAAAAAAARAKAAAAAGGSTDGAEDAADDESAVVTLGWEGLAAGLWADVLRELEDVRALLAAGAGAVWGRLADGQKALEEWAAGVSASARKVGAAWSGGACSDTRPGVVLCAEYVSVLTLPSPST